VKIPVNTSSQVHRLLEASYSTEKGRAQAVKGSNSEWMEIYSRYWCRRFFYCDNAQI